MKSLKRDDWVGRDEQGGRGGRREIGRELEGDQEEKLTMGRKLSEISFQCFFFVKESKILICYIMPL